MGRYVQLDMPTDIGTKIIKLLRSFIASFGQFPPCLSLITDGAGRSGPGTLILPMAGSRPCLEIHLVGV